MPSKLLSVTGHTVVPAILVTLGAAPCRAQTAEEEKLRGATEQKGVTSWATSGANVR